MPARLAPSWRHTRGSLPQPSPRTSFSRSCVPDAAPHPGAPASTLGDKNCSPSQRNRRSPSDRNAVRNHNGIVFGFRAESRSPSTGFPNNFRFLPACRFQRILHYSAAPCFLCITNRFRGRPGFSPKRANSRAHAKSRALRLGKSSAISCSARPSETAMQHAGEECEFLEKRALLPGLRMRRRPVCSLGTLVRRREMFLRKIEQLWTYMSPPKMLKLMGNVSKTETQVSCRVVGS
jgi:hypothetical protein